jgi:hypothetical protein
MSGAARELTHSISAKKHSEQIHPVFATRYIRHSSQRPKSRANCKLDPDSSLPIKTLRYNDPNLA